ncbi:MAG TPA: ROK family protein [Vicinamibacteria bacterium]|nr:ROK family protein [Vicinamibacteria bacterium]
MARKTRPASVDGGARHARHLRGLNLERVLNVAMDRPGSFTRSELIEATGLSAPTVGSLAAELIRSGVVKDVGTGPSSGGRRPSFMELNARHRYVAGIDVGPTRTRLAVADLRGDRVADRIVPTPTGRSPAALLERLGADLRALMKDAEAPMHRLLVVAAGAPGAVDTDSGTVSFAPNLKGWTDVPMRAILERTLGAPVLVDNDVNLAILGEHWQGAARGHQTCAFVFVGTGIGSALLIDGELHRGHSFMAGEIAVMCMGPEYVGRDFGSRGCLETLAGLQALAARWPKGAKGDPEQWMARLFEAAEAGDGEARRAVDETATFIGIAVANVAAVVDPSLVVLGGALMAQGGPLVAEVEKVVKRLSRAPVEIAVSALGKDAPLCGCLLMAATEARRRMPLILGAAEAAAAR